MLWSNELEIKVLVAVILLTHVLDITAFNPCHNYFGKTDVKDQIVFLQKYCKLSNLGINVSNENCFSYNFT